MLRFWMILWVILLSVHSARTQDWGRFRGPNGGGVSAARDLPTDFGPDNNVAWKQSIPFGHSSPVIGGDLVFVTGADDNYLITVALDRREGKILWRSEIPRKRKDTIFPQNSAATPTPVTDDQNVYVFFPEIGLISFDRAGTQRWSLPLGQLHSFYGMGGSPILVGSSVVLVCDQETKAFVVAVDKDSGERRWRTERPGRFESWTTPVVFAPESGPPQIIIQSSFYIDSYHAESGAKLWESATVGYTPVGSPIVHDDTILASTPNHAEQAMPSFEAMAADLDKNKDGRLEYEEVKPTDFGPHFGWMDRDDNGYVDKAEYEGILKDASTENYGALSIRLEPASTPTVQWRQQKGLPYIATPLVFQNRLYLTKDGGIVTILDPSSGDVLQQSRLTGALGQYYASPVAADGKIFFVNTEGKVSVVRAGAEWEVVNVNDLGEEVFATPALADGAIYIRTRSTLYCFGSPAPKMK